MIPVLDERGVHLGSVLHHDHAGVEAFDADGISLGIFSSEFEAVTALWRCARKQRVTNNVLKTRCRQ
jgi:hypothetical protein